MDRSRIADKSKSITPILEGWDYTPDRVTVRRVQDVDGQTRIQMRLDLGILQMRETGRPDGLQPHGCESLLAQYEDQLRQHGEQHGEQRGQETSFTLDAQQCADLKAESMQYYYRYLSAFHLGDNSAVIRDTEHNLRIFDLIRDCAAEASDRASIEEFRPYVWMMNTRAKARMVLDREDYDQALELITEGVQRIEGFLREAHHPELISSSREIQFLRDWAENIRRRPTDSPT